MPDFIVRIHGGTDTAEDVADVLEGNATLEPGSFLVREMPIVADKCLANGTKGVFLESDRYYRAIVALRRLARYTDHDLVREVSAILETLGELR